MKFRNTKNWKLEITLGIVFILILSSVGVWGVTRTITDTSDTIDTYIKNSNGKYWEASFDNIQLAINDLNTTHGGGTVWLPAYDYVATEKLKTYNRSICLIGPSYLGGLKSHESSSTPGALFSVPYSGYDDWVIECGVSGEITYGVEIKNIYIDGRSRPEPLGAINFVNVQNGRIQKIYIDDFYNTDFKCGVGISLIGSATRTNAYNTVENFRIRRCTYGIVLDNTSNINTINLGLIQGDRAEGSNQTGMYLDNADSNVITKVNFQSIDEVDSRCIFINNTGSPINNKFDNCRFESNSHLVNITGGAGTGNNIFDSCTSSGAGSGVNNNGNQPSIFINCIGFNYGYVEFGNYNNDYISINETGAMTFSGLAKITLPVVAANTPADGTMYWNTANDTLAVYDADSSDWRYFTYD